MEEGRIEGAGTPEASENGACDGVVQGAGVIPAQAETSSVAEIQSLKHTEQGKNGIICTKKGKLSSAG